MKSFQYNKIKEEGIYEEVFIGAFDGLRNNSYIKERGTMSEQTGLPFTNQDLKRIERNLKNKGHFFHSEGTFGTRSLFYWDKKMNKFLGFQYLVKDYENNAPEWMKDLPIKIIRVPMS